MRSNRGKLDKLEALAKEATTPTAARLNLRERGGVFTDYLTGTIYTADQVAALRKAGGAVTVMREDGRLTHNGVLMARVDPQLFDTI